MESKCSILALKFLLIPLPSRSFLPFPQPAPESREWRGGLGSGNGREGMEP
jgi:hypothetical protein